MQIMERSLKLEKLSKPGANIWENMQDNDGNEKFKLSDIFIFKYIQKQIFGRTRKHDGIIKLSILISNIIL